MISLIDLFHLISWLEMFKIFKFRFISFSDFSSVEKYKSNFLKAMMNNKKTRKKCDLTAKSNLS